MNNLINEKTENYIIKIDRVIEKGKYKDNWQSLMNHKTPDWYYNGKFGIFIHWGIYSVPAMGNEWYPRNMYIQGSVEYEHHIKTFGEHKNFGYKDFIPMFKASAFSADEWAEAFRNAGAQFVMPVAEHHDGFAMYSTEFNRWNAKNMGPCRDVMAELKSAVERNNMTFCLSNHRAEHYFFLNGGRRFDSDLNNPETEDFYGPAVDSDELLGDMGSSTESVDGEEPSEEWLKDWLCRICEMVDKFQPKIVYFDWWIQNKAFKPYLKKFAAYYYNRALEWGAEVTINYKHNAFAPGVATLDIERGALGGISPFPWQTDTSIGKLSWGYRKDNKYKSTYDIATTLIDVVSKNGMLLLNVGPKSDGTITDEELTVLREIGQWLKVNGEGIYGTTPWLKYREGEAKVASGAFSEGDVPYTDKDFRFTYKNGAVYAFCMNPSENKSVTVKSLAAGFRGTLVKKVTVLANGEEPEFSADENGLHFTLSSAVSGGLPVCYKIELE